MIYTPKQKRIIKALFMEGGKDVVDGITRGKSLTDIIQKQVRKTKAELKAKGFELKEDAIFTGISWGLIQRLKETSYLPSFLKEEEDLNPNDLSMRLLKNI